MRSRKEAQPLIRTVPHPDMRPDTPASASTDKKNLPRTLCSILVAFHISSSTPCGQFCIVFYCWHYTSSTASPRLHLRTPHWYRTHHSTAPPTSQPQTPAPSKSQSANSSNTNALSKSPTNTPRISPPTLRTVLSRATSEIEANFMRFGDDAPVLDDVVVGEDSLLFVAESDRHSPTVELTWGILEEAWRVLRDFLRGRPHPLRVVVVEGLTGRGPRLGEMVLFDYEPRRRRVGLVESE